MVVLMDDGELPRHIGYDDVMGLSLGVRAAAELACPRRLQLRYSITFQRYLVLIINSDSFVLIIKRSVERIGRNDLLVCPMMYILQGASAAT